MSDLKPTGTKIKLGNRELGMRFTLNAMDDIQEKFEIPISELGTLFTESIKQIHNLRYLLTLLINEDIDCQNDTNGTDDAHVDERFVGRHIDAANMNDMIGCIYKSYAAGSPKSEEESPNGESA